MINVKLWTDESLAAGKLTTVWVKAKGVPKTLKKFHGVCEVGSTLGLHLEADMHLLKNTGQVRLKVAVVNHMKIPKWTRLTTPKLYYYRIYFQLEEVVELGWDREEEDFLQDFEDIMDSQLEEKSDRDPKRQKSADKTAPSPSGQIITSEKQVVASTHTLIALADREKSLTEQDEVDIRNNTAKTGTVLVQQLDKETVNTSDIEGTGNTTEGGEDSGEERVKLSDEEMDEDFEASQTFSEKVKEFTGRRKKTVSNSQEDIGTRNSARLADKNPEDMPVMDLAKNIKAKGLDKEEGIGGRKTGATAGRKTTGASRG